MLLGSGSGSGVGKEEVELGYTNRKLQNLTNRIFKRKTYYLYILESSLIIYLHVDIHL